MTPDLITSEMVEKVLEPAQEEFDRLEVGPYRDSATSVHGAVIVALKLAIPEIIEKCAKAVERHDAGVPHDVGSDEFAAIIRNLITGSDARQNNALAPKPASLVTTFITNDLVEKAAKAIFPQTDGFAWARRNARACIEAVLPDIIEHCAKTAEREDPHDYGDFPEAAAARIRSLSPPTTKEK